MRLDNDVDVVRSFFSLGGFLNMSGVAPETLVGPNYAILRGIYYRQIGAGGTGFLNVPVYIGASVEEGNVWSSRRAMSFGSAQDQRQHLSRARYHPRPGLLRHRLRRGRRLGLLPVPRPNFLSADAHDGKRRRSGGVREWKRECRACGYSPRDSCSFSTLSSLSAGLSPGREYSCLRAISMSAASRSARCRTNASCSSPRPAICGTGLPA